MRRSISSSFPRWPSKSRRHSCWGTTNLSATRLGNRSDLSGTTVSSPGANGLGYGTISLGRIHAGRTLNAGHTGVRDSSASWGGEGWASSSKPTRVALNRAVALKMIKSGGFASEGELLRFQNEAEAVAQLDHPHIVPIYEVGQHLGRHFFSMKLIAGKSLDERLGDFAADFRKTARVMATVARAVHHAHQRGILHRDLKPANILLDEHGEPHVTDFGLAKQIEGNGELTESGAPMGTPSYMAPEQASGDKGSLSTATDVYGLGTILYALLAGRAPFAGTTLLETLDKVRNSARPSSPRCSTTGCRATWRSSASSAWRKSPTIAIPARWPWLKTSTAGSTGMPILARPVGSLTRAAMWCRRNKALASLAALLMLALVGGLAGVTWKWREADHERAKAEAVNELLTRRLLAQASLELDPLAKNLTVRELLDRAAIAARRLARRPARDRGQDPRDDRRGVSLTWPVRTGRKTPPHRGPARQPALRPQVSRHAPGATICLRRSSTRPTAGRKPSRFCGKTSTIAASSSVATTRLPSTRPNAWERSSGTSAKGDEAETVLRKNVDDRSRVLKPEHPDTLRSTYLLSRLLRERRQFADAETFCLSLRP